MMPGGQLWGLCRLLQVSYLIKWGARILAIIGIMITVISQRTYFSTLSLTTPYSELVILYTVRSFGMAMVMMPIMTNGLNQLPRRLYPHGTAMNNTLQNVGGAIGSALLITVYSKQSDFHSEALMTTAMSKLTDNPTAEALGCKRSSNATSNG